MSKVVIDNMLTLDKSIDVATPSIWLSVGFLRLRQWIKFSFGADILKFLWITTTLTTLTRIIFWVNYHLHYTCKDFLFILYFQTLSKFNWRIYYIDYKLLTSKLTLKRHDFGFLTSAVSFAFSHIYIILFNRQMPFTKRLEYVC